MTKFEKLREAINSLPKMETDPIDKKRYDLKIAIGQIMTDLRFLQPDLRYKWERDELMQKMQDLLDQINRKEFF
jgi:hypothetical protein|tara:strand:- start:79 stop:300 length:222 start_codon:yes stop_codon:yes gene_type:complete